MITIPTISQLYSDILADISSSYGSQIPSFAKNFLRAIAGVQAAKMKLYYLAIANLQKNIFVDTADSISNGGTLERFGFIKLGRFPFPAVAAQYTVSVVGTVGSTIPALTQFKSDDQSSNPGMLFILDNAYKTISNPDFITVRALTPGSISQLNIGDTMTATAPIIGINSSPVTVSSEIVTPLDAEDIEAYRQAAIEAYQLEPQGGAATDYRLWSLDAQGVKQTYPYAASGQTGVVNLYVEAVASASPDGKGTPSAAILSSVQSVVEFNPNSSLPLSSRGRRPLQVIVNYLPVSIIQVDIQIQGFAGVTAAQKTLIFNTLQLYINLIRPFVGAADILANKNDVLNVNNIISQILLAIPGASFGVVTLSINTVATPSYQFTNGNIPYFNSVTYS